MNSGKIVFIDTEISYAGKTVQDIGAVKGDGRELHSKSLPDLANFLRGSKYVCGHNILKHDLKYIGKEISDAGAKFFIDTLYLSPLLFPKKPYHRLVKDDKLTVDELNNPLSDAKKARDLFYDEKTAFSNLDDRLKHIYFALLSDIIEFKDFFRLIGYRNTKRDVGAIIRETFAGKICANARIEKLVKEYPAELAYSLALISVIEHDSATPAWVIRNYPRVEYVLHSLRGRQYSGRRYLGGQNLSGQDRNRQDQPCPSCDYCDEFLDETKALKRFFHYDAFRTYGGEPLQQSAVVAAINGESILAIFPTGGGKSITFQLPALMAGVNERGLTVVISPLQSLMKDQTDNLEHQHNITDAVTINGSLDPLERAKAFERVENGSASILYISPESLRSKSIERLLLNRNVVRFVIDEAHCFSSWGQDFRVDYLYIGDFISALQKEKNMEQSIPVSCFTATAKQKVIDDIKAYFKNKLSLELKEIKADATRVNLNYHVFSEESSGEKDIKLRQLLCDNDCPTIIYVSRTRQTERLAEKLTGEGFAAKAYHGQMDKQLRAENQDAFMSGEVNIIVATTAFGMGVDKKDVGMVIHYDISDSLENYVQEAGRAGRDENMQADCYVLFNDEDLNKHFNMLNQTKLSQKEIQQVWKALKELTKYRAAISQSALEIARMSGWDDSITDMESRVKTAISALEQSGFVRRGQNMPRIFADSILVNNMEEARRRIDRSARFDDASRQQAIRIMGSLISAKSKSRGKDEEGESRVDHISDRLGIVKEDVIRVIGLLREEKILADAKDLVAYIKRGEKKNRSKTILSAYNDIESFLLRYLDDEEKTYNIKEMNEELHKEFDDADTDVSTNAGNKPNYADTSINQINTLMNYFAIKRFVKRTKERNKNYVTLRPYFPLSEIQRRSVKRRRIAEVIIDYLYSKAINELDIQNAGDTQSTGDARDFAGIQNIESKVDAVVGFSVLELKEEFEYDLSGEKVETEEIEDALYYLLKIGALRIEGGFLVIYNAMRIERLETDSRAQYKKEHYAKLDEYYQNKRQQIHIVGEYARRLIEDYLEAMEFVNDYFTMKYDRFLNKYFKNRREEITRNITPAKFKQLFGELSPKQLNIIKDQESKCIVVAAGPGSGKTKLLAHKLASLYMMEDVKHEQMLMLTFSRAAATEFKTRLMTLIGNAANFIQIATFHSYCFDLLGKVGDIAKSETIIGQTVGKINAGEVDVMRLTKTVLVIDEAQDMSEVEYSLVKALMEKNDDLRVIAVGDDDQNIYEFRDSSSEYFKSLLDEPGSKKYELVDNYRSGADIVDFANQFAQTISSRFKTQPIVSNKKAKGRIAVCKLASDRVVIPAVKAIIKLKPSGTTCIVTRTNEESFNIAALLLKEGIPVRQIQSNKDFNLYNLVELRDFAGYIDAVTDSYTISDEVWQRAKSGLNKKYSESENLRSVLKLLGDFEQTHNKTKYKSDFNQFIRESKLEDFVSESEGTIFVSTIHQTKGREFENVFLALSRFSQMDDKAKRAIYVAVTRAKQRLHIFYNGNYFDGIDIENIKRYSDQNIYPEPPLIYLQLSHEDIFLSYCANCRKAIDSLVSGCRLSLQGTSCFSEGKEVMRFSNKFCEQMDALKAKGYVPVRAYVRHIIFWEDKSKECEIKIVLPNVEFEKRGLSEQLSLL